MGCEFVGCASRRLNTSRGTASTFNDAWDNIAPLVDLSVGINKSGGSGSGQ